MSQDSKSSNDKETSIPQFMREEQSYIDMPEEENSWLSNNLHKTMIIVSVIWFAFVLIYITQFFGWSNLFLMMPDEFGGFMAGVTLPLVVFWVAMAYIDRGTSFKHEAKFLRAYMNQLVYPEDNAPQTAKAMADAIRSQVVELQQVSKLAHEQTSTIKDAIKENVDDFSKLVSKLDSYSSHTIVELSEGVKFLMSNFENIVQQAQNSSNNLLSINQQIVEDSTNVKNTLSDLIEKNLYSIQSIKNSSEELKDLFSHVLTNMNKSNDEIKNFNQMTEKTFNDGQNLLNNQIDLLGQVSEKAYESCENLKASVVSEINNLEGTLHKYCDKIENAVSSVSQEAKNKAENLVKLTTNNISDISSAIKNEMQDVEKIFDNQVDKIDIALNKHSKEISSFVKVIDERADVVTKKFASHSDLVAQELEKLMVRTSNIEEGVAMRVANLNNVSDKVVRTLQNVDENLLQTTTSLDEKIANANDDISSYIDTLNEKSNELDRINDQVIDYIDVINNSSKELQKVMSTSLNQLQEADKDINSSTENLLVQVTQSVESLGNVATIMQKHTAGLTDVSSVVVTQSQISENSLMQQQKYIADTASKVEFIKDELRRQIDELAITSETLEKNAISASDTLKNHIQKMVGSCNDILDKSRVINDNISDQAMQFDTSVNKTITKVTQFENVMGKQLQNLDVMSKKVDDRSENISRNISSCVQKIDEVSDSAVKIISDAISEFNLKSENISTVSKNAAEYIDNVANTIDNKVANLNITFRQQEADFYAYSNKMSDTTSKVVEVMKKQMNEISSDSDKIYDKITILEEATTNKTDAMISNLNKSVQKLLDIGKTFEDKHQHTIKTVDNAIDKLGSINANITDQMDNLNSKIKEIDANAADSVSNINISSSKLKSMHQELIKDSNQAWQKINEQTKYLENVGSKFQTQSGNIIEMFTHQKNNIQEVVNNVVTQARLGEAAMAQQFKYLTDATVEVASKIQTINNDFKNNTGNIFDITNKMSYEFDVLGDRLVKACDSINKASKDSIKNIDQVSIRLNQCGEDLDSTIHHSVANIGGVFNEYEKYLAGFNTITAETSTGVVEINELIAKQSDKMVKISDDTKKLVECFNTVLNDTSLQLANRANDAYEKVKDLGLRLKHLGNEMEEATKLSATHLEKSGDKLRASVNEIAANAERISNNILNSGDVFVKQSQTLSALADNTSEKVKSSLNKLVEVGRNFEEQGQSLIKESSLFNDSLNAQLKTLSTATEKAEKIMKGLTTTYKEIKVDSFIKDSTKIMQVLENISVDLTRLLHIKNEDDLWKKFYNGDTQIFIRTLSKNITNAQIDVIRKEFAKNDELRGLVIKYMNEFECLVEKSKNHEHATSLMAVISGSDLGRLYYILSKALNKLN